MSEIKIQNEDLKKQAQQKLSAARQLIREAGELAKQGQFYLNFGTIGEFVPSSFDDRAKIREMSLESLKKDGLRVGYDFVFDDPNFPHGKHVEREHIPFDQLTPDQIEEALDDLVSEYYDNSEVSYPAREYGTRDDWWSPSTC